MSLRPIHRPIRTIRRHGRGAAQAPAIYAATYLVSGQSQMPSGWALNVNGTSRSPLAVYLASGLNSGTGAWTAEVGSAQTKQAGSPTYDVDCLFGVGGSDVWVHCDDDSWWDSDTNPYGQPGSGDLLVVGIYMADSAGGFRGVVHHDESGTGGWTLYVSNSGGTTWWMKELGGSQVTRHLSHADLEPIIAVGFCDRDETTYGVNLWLNNADDGWTTAANADGTLDRSIPMSLANIDTSDGGPFHGWLHAMAVYFADDMFPGGATNDTVAESVHKEITSRWCGLWPSIAPDGDEIPSITRSTGKLYTRADQGLIHYLPGALMAIDDSGLDADGEGLWIEGAATNSCTTFSARSNWFLNNVTEADGGLSPMAKQGIDWADITEEASTASHGYISGISGTITQYAVDNNEYISWSTVIKTGARRYLEVIIYEQGAGSAAAAFIRIDTNDWSVLESGDTGHANALTYVNHVVEQIGTDIYRVRLIGQNETGASKNYRLGIFGAATDDAYASVESYLGSAAAVAFSSTINTAVIGSSVHYGTDIETSGGTETRNADQIDIHADVAAALETAGTGTLQCDVLLASQDLLDDATIFSLNDGSATEAIELKIAATGDRLEADSRSSGGNDGDANDTTDIVDGSWHTVAVAWSTGRLAVQVDGGTAVADETVDIPTGLNELNFGRNATDGAYLNARVRNLQIFDYERF